MQRKAKRASLPLDSVDVDNISESQKKHYSKLGYKPYLSHCGKIKWLSFEQHAYELIKYNEKKKKLSLKRLYSRSHHFTRTLNGLYKSIFRNWITIVLILLILVVLINIKMILTFVANFNF
jgi:hypothetical protein